MKRTITLLAGLNQAGASAIEKACLHNAGKLAEQGLIYPPATEFDNLLLKGVKNHSMLLRSLVRKSRPERMALSRDAMSAYLTRTQNDSQLIFIAEGVSTLPADELADLGAWFAEHDVQLKVLCLVRRLGPWVNSLVAQQVAGLRGPRKSIPAVLDEFLSAAGFVTARIKNLTSAFPDAEFVCYETVLEEFNTPAAWFFAKLGVTDCEMPSKAEANAGRTDNAVRLLSYLNRSIGPAMEDGQRNPRQLQKQEYDLLAALPGIPFELREGEMAPLRSLIDAENLWLQEHLGEAFFDPQLQFRPTPYALRPALKQQLLKIAQKVRPKKKQLIEAFVARGSRPK